MTEISTDDIARRAHKIWQAEGRLHGRDVDHWLQAEAELGVTRTPQVTSGEAKRPPTARRPATNKP